MSVSSGTTLISPPGSTTTSTTRAQQPPAPPQQQRRTSVTSSQGQGHHHTHGHGHGHAHGHGHGHHTKRKTSGHVAGRRGSETDQGRRAMAAGLAMHVMEAAGAAGTGGLKPPKRRTSTDRPLKKSSRSDTHLPRLSRTTSIASNVSEDVVARQRPKGKGRKRSGESVQIVSQDGKESGTNVDSEEEDWEESGDESKQPEEGDRPSSRSQAPPSTTTKGKGKAKFVVEESTAMRRTVSDTQAQPPIRLTKSTTTSPLALQAVGSGSIASNGESVGSGSSSHPLNPRQRTLGFAGPVGSGDPQTSAQRHINEQMPHWNDSTHVKPAHQIKHQKSISSLHAMGEEKGYHAGHGQGIGMSRMVSNGDHSHVKNSQMDGAPTYAEVASEEPSSHPMVEPSTNSTQATAKQRMSAPPIVTSGPPNGHQAGSSTVEPHRVRHRASNTSLRSLQSIRAPPHPLNSPTGYRTGLPPSRVGSTANSPNSKESRGPSMHHPPIAPPVLYREVATGHGWDIPEDEEYEYSTPLAKSATLPNESTRPGINATANGSMSKNGNHSARQTSISSQRSLQSLLRPQVASPSSSTSSHRPRHHSQQHPDQSSSNGTPRRRKTALEAASRASKYQSTTDPVLYHHSLGHSATSAETAHLISRFLPLKKVPRPSWEITAENLDTHSGIGLSRGDYRDAHESLIRSMKELGVSHPTSQQAAAVRRLSYHSLLGSATSMSKDRDGHLTLGGAGRAQDGLMGKDGTGSLGVGILGGVGGAGADGGVGIGMVSGRNGPMVVARGGGWRGKTPFELSLERCLAQRPVRPYGQS